MFPVVRDLFVCCVYCSFGVYCLFGFCVVVMVLLFGSVFLVLCFLAFVLFGLVLVRLCFVGCVLCSVCVCRVCVSCLSCCFIGLPFHWFELLVCLL